MLLNITSILNFQPCLRMVQPYFEFSVNSLLISMNMNSKKTKMNLSNEFTYINISSINSIRSRNNACKEKKPELFINTFRQSITKLQTYTGIRGMYYCIILLLSGATFRLEPRRNAGLSPSHSGWNQGATQAYHQVIPRLEILG